MTLTGEIAVMLQYFFIILNHGRAVLLAIAKLLVSNLHTAVASILSISSAFLFESSEFFSRSNVELKSVPNSRSRI